MTVEPMLQADPLAPGLRLGRYELIRRLAVGGMAEIYLARATGIEGFEKLVVLKRILPQFAKSSSFVSMFLDEARISATLQHPNIAQVHDIGQHHGSYFFTMEYIRGEDVRTLLKTVVRNKQRVPLSHTLTIIIGAAAGLHAAHEKCDLDGVPLNIVHRDVSPSNVLVSYDGSVKLLDFGVAKAAQRQTQTQAGTLKGKVSYMSPEQCLGKALDRRSDIFALGILLYELTCRRRLFKGDSEFKIMTKIVKEDVTPPSQFMKNFPKGLELILMRALRRKQADRYATAQEMQVDLEEFARRNRLAVSTVKLGDFMREMFVDQMREAEAAIKNRPRTEELDEVEIDVNIDLNEHDDGDGAGDSFAGDVEEDSGAFDADDADDAEPAAASDVASSGAVSCVNVNETRVGSGFARRRASTQHDMNEPGVSALSEISRMVGPRLKLPLAALAAAALTATAFLYTEDKRQSAEATEATELVVPHARSAAVAEEIAEPQPTSKPLAPAVVPPAAAPAVAEQPAPVTKPAVAVTAQPAKHRARRRSMAKRSRAKRTRPKPKSVLVKPKKKTAPASREWGLDSPLPPPRRK